MHSAESNFEGGWFADLESHGVADGIIDDDPKGRRTPAASLMGRRPTGAPHSSERSPNGAVVPDQVVSAEQHIVHPVGSQRLDGLAKYCQQLGFASRVRRMIWLIMVLPPYKQGAASEGTGRSALLQPLTGATDITHPATGSDTRTISTILASGACEANPARGRRGLDNRGGCGRPPS